MQATEIQRNDTIAIRRSNERKFREGLVQDVQVQSFAGFESICAVVAFDKTTEIVDLSTANWKLVWRLEEAN